MLCQKKNGSTNDKTTCRTHKWKTWLKCSKVDCGDSYAIVGILKPIELYTLTG